jgi:hypothetical protein
MLTAIQSLAEAPAAPTLAIIINCGTKWVSSLALVSTLAHTDCPVLVVNCESKDGSRAHFEWLARDGGLDLHWLEWPLRRHPTTLDNLFREVRAHSVLLVDSDVEIRTRRLYDAMRSALSDCETSFGSGFVHGPHWLGQEHGLPPYAGYYAERMWIPLVLLRSAIVREGLAAGLSFTNRRPFFEIPRSPKLSRLVGYRYRIRGLRQLKIPALPSAGDAGGVRFDGHRPAFVEYDTGADLYKGLLDRGYRFAGLPIALWGDVHHYHGMTRAALTGLVRRAAKRLHLASVDAETEQASVLLAIKSRLRETYGIGSAGGPT